MVKAGLFIKRGGDKLSFIDKIILEGNISRINDNNNDNFIWFDICKNEKYKNKNGEEQEVTSFFSAKVERNKIKNNDLFKVGSWIVITGIPKSYLDKNNYKKFYIFTLDIIGMKEFQNQKQKEKKDSIFSYDDDGVMLWHGKRCESEECTPEELEEMDKLLSEFR